MRKVTSYIISRSRIISTLNAEITSKLLRYSRIEVSQFASVNLFKVQITRNVKVNKSTYVSRNYNCLFYN